MCTYEEKNTYTHDRNSIHDTSCRSSSAYMRDSNRFRLVTSNMHLNTVIFIVKDHSLHSFKEICSSYEIVMPVVCLKFGFETIFLEIKLFLHKE